MYDKLVSVPSALDFSRLNLENPRYVDDIANFHIGERRGKVIKHYDGVGRVVSVLKSPIVERKM